MSKDKIKLVIIVGSNPTNSDIEVNKQIQRLASKKEYPSYYHYPESKEHPSNIISFVQSLSDRLEKSGVPIVILTHSDFMIRELNHLTALYTFKHLESVQHYLKSDDNPYKSEMLIDPNSVIVIDSGNPTIKIIPNEYGTFSIESLDKVIRIQKNNKDSIFSAILVGEEDED
jgi:AAA15 family ATPase/GTPase